MFDRPTTESPINDRILGTDYRGTSRTTSTLGLDTVPDSEGVSLKVTLSGQVVSDSRGFGQGAVIYSRGTTTIDASKILSWRQGSLQLLPAEAFARTDSQIQRVSAGGRIRSRAARQEAQARRPATEQEVSRRIAAAFGEQLDRQVADMVQQRRESLIRRVWLPLMTRDALPRWIAGHSDSDAIDLIWLAANSRQLSTSDVPPPLPAEEQSSDVVLRVHESCLQNFVASAGVGQRWSLDKLDESLRNGLGWSLDGLSTDPEERPWTIEFADRLPLQVRFSGGAVVLQIQAHSFTVGETEYPAAVIRARYVLTPGMDFAQREGDLQITLPAPGDEQGPRLGVRQQVFRSLLRRRFGRLLAEQLHWPRVRVARALGPGQAPPACPARG